LGPPGKNAFGHHLKKSTIGLHPGNNPFNAHGSSSNYRDAKPASHRLGQLCPTEMPYLAKKL